MLLEEGGRLLDEDAITSGVGVRCMCFLDWFLYSLLSRVGPEGASPFMTSIVVDGMMDWWLLTADSALVAPFMSAPKDK